MDGPSPASETKHLSVLPYPFFGSTFQLQQRSDHGLTNGTTLWPGGQILSLFIASIYPRVEMKRDRGTRRPRALELGSGIGLTALALSSLGWDVLATDTSLVLSSVLTGNVDANRSALPASAGVIQTKELDWTVDPTEWTWKSRSAIATRTQNTLDVRPDLASHLEPPFDLIVTADTIYSEELALPLLRCLHKLASLSTSDSGWSPPVYVCVERRDPGLLDRTLHEAESSWGFTVERIPETKIKRAMKKSGVTWNKSDWEGVEIWKLRMCKPRRT